VYVCVCVCVCASKYSAAQGRDARAHLNVRVFLSLSILSLSLFLPLCVCVFEYLCVSVCSNGLCHGSYIYARVCVCAVEGGEEEGCEGKKEHRRLKACLIRGLESSLHYCAALHSSQHNHKRLLCTLGCCFDINRAKSKTRQVSLVCASVCV
jgi:hypothetical protein